MTTTPFRPGTIGHAALEYARRGIHIFPTWWAEQGACACRQRQKCTRPAKHPLVRWETQASSDPATITEYWLRWPRANVGIPTGLNGLAVIDVDPAHGGERTIAILARWLETTHGIDLYATRLIRTGGGGMHLYFHAPDVGITTRAASFHRLDARPGDPGLPGVDTRGNGGYVIAPPSVHVSGGVYQTIHTGSPMAPWPPQLTTRMAPAEQPAIPTASAPMPTPARPISAGAGPATIENRLRAWARRGHAFELASVRGARKGGRNDRLNTAAYRAGLKLDARLLPDRRATERELYAAAAGWIGDDCTPAEIMATIRSGLDAAEGQARLKLRLPPWAVGYIITPRGNR